ncbi:D-arabinono-1,4-lactone oxidase [Agromyces silvae]|uniref:D-arabinono-1,4-lactone oxidase n=1 Tax=Agromyces silvae TaxID=3388266 RepID=UPI00280AFE0F|nr:D-arabinono-1,4-lactone oxidase [Agromyces protaetiae]
MTATGALWRNWARTQQVRPLRVERPANAGAVQRAVAAAAASQLRVKPAGAGHSFTGIGIAPDVLLDLGELTGVVAADPANHRVTLGAGTRLHALPRLLAPYRLAMQNMGDVDRQTISGAISTGTHGTGLAFGGIATRVVGARLVTGTGELLEVSDTSRPDLLPAIQVGLGALGVLVDVTLELVPRFLLHAVERPEPLEAVLEAWPERAAGADHFEFYWFPHTETALTKSNTRLPADAPRHPLGRVTRFVEDEVVANGLFRAVCVLGRLAPAVTPVIAKQIERITGNREFTDASPEVFTSRRGVRFVEMEYAIPFEAVPEALTEVRALIARRGWRISFPIEVRAAAADDTWLSTAYGRRTGYLAVHRYFRENPTEYFGAVEEILLAHGGRPHWGKMHTLRAPELRERYPRFDDFLRVRDELDPDRRFANPYLERVLGP